MYKKERMSCLDCDIINHNKLKKNKKIINTAKYCKNCYYFAYLKTESSILNNCAQCNLVTNDEYNKICFNCLQRLFTLTREQIVHEDNLTNQRCTWLLQSNIFLFSAYVGSFLVVNKMSLISVPILIITRLVISSLGVVISYSTRRSLSAAFNSIQNLITTWNNQIYSHSIYRQCFPQIAGLNIKLKVNKSIKGRIKSLLDTLVYIIMLGHKRFSKHINREGRLSATAISFISMLGWLIIFATACNETYSLLKLYHEWEMATILSEIF